jgi:hypothetical protein
MKRHRGLLLALALIALFGLSANQAHAEVIVMTVQVDAGPVVDLSVFGGVGTANGYTMDATAIANLNAFLTTSGSQYQFASSGATTLGGVSNFPGSSTAGILGLTGTILSVQPGIAGLTLTETEADFTSPVGPSGLLASSSTGNFVNDPVGTGHVASSSFNATTAGPYSVLSTGGVAGNNNKASIGLAPVPTLYTLKNTISFNLAAGSATNPVVDGFNVLAAVTTVPEPASLVMMLTGLPLPIVVFGWLRRRRAAA